MLPLIVDRLYRGRNNFHLAYHPKLVKHRTLIKGALPLAQYLVTSAYVESVALGRTVNIQVANGGWALKFEESKKLNRLKIVVTDGKALQWITVKLTKYGVVSKMQNEINTRFAN